MSLDYAGIAGAHPLARSQGSTAIGSADPCSGACRHQAEVAENAVDLSDEGPLTVVGIIRDRG